MLSPTEPKKGSLLISEPFMMDPNFKRSVVLLAEETEDGIVGYVLNQKSNVQLKDIMPDLPEAEFPVYVGGPVANDTLHFVHRCYDRMNSGDEIRDGVYWGGNFETLKLLIENKLITADEIRFFIGYSGWGNGQLDAEFQENAWLVTNKFPIEVVFDANEEHLWKEVVIGLGPKYAHIANFPENPMWN